MASIKGLSIKGINYFKGHEEERLAQGNLYFKNKKVGWFSEGDFGGEMSIKVTPEVENLFKSYKCKDDYPFYGIEWAIVDLLSLIPIEKDLKVSIKNGKGASIRVVLHGFQLITYHVSKEKVIRDGEAKIKEEVLKLLAKSHPNVTEKDITSFEIYTSLDMFNL